MGEANRPCIKNIFELKQGSDAIIRWNSGENSFNGCGAQWNGFVYTVRNGGFRQGGFATLSPDRLTVTISNYSPFGGLFAPRVGYLLGISKISTPVPDRPGPNIFEYRTIVSTGPGADTYKVNTPFPATLPALSNAEWGIVAVPGGHIHNIYTYGNFLRNVGTGMLTLGRDDSHEGGILSGVTFKNNLMVNESPLMTASPVQFFQQQVAKVVNAGENIVIDNNTFMVKDTIHPSQRIPSGFFEEQQDDPVRNNITKGLKLRNNISPWGLYGITSSGLGANDTWNLRNDAGLEFRNNVLLGLNAFLPWQSLLEGCTAPRICKDNTLVTAAFDFRDWLVNPSDNEYQTQSQVPKGYNDSQSGVNLEEVPLIRGLSIVPGVKHLQFQWRVSQILRVASCSLEVSPQSHLINDTGVFTVVNALRPDFFKRANFDLYNSRSMILSDGIARFFQVGEDIVVTDDLGQQRDLALQPDTTYFYRIMCGGTTERGSVRTLADTSAAGNAGSDFEVTVNYRPLLGSQVRARYGGFVSSLSVLPSIACAQQCTVKLPWRGGRSLVIYLDELNQNGQVVLAATQPIIVPSR